MPQVVIDAVLDRGRQPCPQSSRIVHDHSLTYATDGSRGRSTRHERASPRPGSRRASSGMIASVPSLKKTPRRVRPADDDGDERRAHDGGHDQDDE